MTRRKKLMFAGAAASALLVAGLGTAGAIAGPRVVSPSEEGKAVIEDAASQLGVEPSELSDALRQALKNRVDDAVEGGRLTEEQAEELKQRVDASEHPLLGGLGLFGRGLHGHWPWRFGTRRALLETAASYLGLPGAEVRKKLRDRTLAEIAEERGKTAAGLVEQLVATQTRRIDGAVADGRITEEQAAELEAALEQRMQALVHGEFRSRGDSFRFRFWPGSGSARAPPAFGGPRA